MLKIRRQLRPRRFIYLLFYLQSFILFYQHHFSISLFISDTYWFIIRFSLLFLIFAFPFGFSSSLSQTITTHQSQKLPIQQKQENNSQIQLIMKSTTIVNHVLGSIIKESKNILHDKAVTREKLPAYSNSKAEALNYGLIMHEGYGAQTIKRDNFLSLKKDQLPQHIRKDQFSCKTIDVVHIAKQKDHHLDHIIGNKSSLHHFKKKVQIKKKQNFKKTNALQIKIKQNTFLKLPNERTSKIIINRIKQRQQNQQQSMRQSKRQSLIREYEEKKLLLANKIQRDENNGKMKQLLQCHTQKGQNYKFTFDISGDLLIFKEETDKIIKKNYPLQTTYRLQDDNRDNEEIKIKQNEGRYQKNSKSSRKNQNEKTLNFFFNQNHKIKTARGLAFASSVMKTLNLSRISMNETINTDQQQFMKRNDLFNNNHSRQTTNVPYFTLKTGTVYKQLTTNQVVSNQADQKKNRQFSESSANSQNTIEKNNQFQFGKKTCPKTAIKSTKSFDQKEDNRIQTNNEMIETKLNGDQQNLKILSSFKKRPQTCRIGHIITANKQLAMSMIE